jgi:SAM-dependent methyltransferase
MSGYDYAQKVPMENDAMIRTLDTQARAIWPQERPRLAGLLPRPGLAVLDVGCGTGEISLRIAREFAPALVAGIDLAATHVRRAHAAAEPAGAFGVADAHRLPFTSGSFDLALCRHMLQAIPRPNDVVREMLRVVRPGGHVYFLAEDYGMLFFHPTRTDLDEFFGGYGGRAAARAGSDLRNGRKMPSILAQLGCDDVAVEYFVIDTLRVDRTLLAAIFTHWRDGFVEWISEHAGKPLDDVRERFDDMIVCTARPDGYAAWLIPSISARVPRTIATREIL